MRTAVRVILFHNMSTDSNPEHDRCPSGLESWCFYQSAIARNKGSLPPPHPCWEHQQSDHTWCSSGNDWCIWANARPKSAKEVSQRETQNANECLHSVIWSRCSNTVFVGKLKLHNAIASAVTSFNEGACHMSQVLQKLGVELLMMSSASRRHNRTVQTEKKPGWKEARAGQARDRGGCYIWCWSILNHIIDQLVTFDDIWRICENCKADFITNTIFNSKLLKTIFWQYFVISN